ncbi:UvrB/UvrC motif-containing protein [Bacillus sp. JCM 19041]
MEKRVEELRDALDLHVRDEEFEKAAELRDKIKILKKQIEEAKGGE